MPIVGEGARARIMCATRSALVRATASRGGHRSRRWVDIRRHLARDATWYGGASTRMERPSAFRRKDIYSNSSASRRRHRSLPNGGTVRSVQPGRHASRDASSSRAATRRCDRRPPRLRYLTALVGSDERVPIPSSSSPHTSTFGPRVATLENCRRIPAVSGPPTEGVRPGLRQRLDSATV